MKQDKPLSFALIGRSGCGKGTQAELLNKHFGNLFSVSTGNLLRDLAKSDTSVGKEIKKILTNGELIPDFMIIGLWMRELCVNLKDEQGILFDGALRRLIEAQQADEFLDFLGRKENFFPILIDISREEAFGRLTKRRICKKCGKLIPWVGEFKKLEKCDNCGGELIGRQDDNPDAIKNRLDFFDSEVKEVLDYYKKDNRLITINGEQPIEKVFKDILSAIQQ
jgi:adenylate kinase